MRWLACRRLLIFVIVCTILLTGLFFIYESIDKTTLAVLQVDEYEVRIIYDRDNMPILWAGGVGGLIWDARGNDRKFTGRLPSQFSYDLVGDAIVEINASHPGGFTITDWESKDKSEWEVVVEDDGRVIVREITTSY